MKKRNVAIIIVFILIAIAVLFGTFFTIYEPNLQVVEQTDEYICGNIASLTVKDATIQVGFSGGRDLKIYQNAYYTYNQQCSNDDAIQFCQNPDNDNGGRWHPIRQCFGTVPENAYSNTMNGSGRTGYDGTDLRQMTQMNQYNCRSNHQNKAFRFGSNTLSNINVCFAVDDPVKAYNKVFLGIEEVEEVVEESIEEEIVVEVNETEVADDVEIEIVPDPEIVEENEILDEEIDQLINDTIPDDVVFEDVVGEEVDDRNLLQKFWDWLKNLLGIDKE